MDWGTHLVLAKELLEVCNLEKGAAIHSNLPAIDSKPPEFHRVYAHIIENMPPLLDASLAIFGNGTIKDDYVHNRILDEKAKFLELQVEMLGIPENDVGVDKLSAAVSLISHIFFDTFNNPVQAFLPYSSLASGQWELWESIDYMAFRKEFYKDTNIREFRQYIATTSCYLRPARDLNPEAMIKAMIVRIAEQGSPPVLYEATDWVIRKFLRYLGVEGYQRVDKELEFLKGVEALIKEYILKEYPTK